MALVLGIILIVVLMPDRTTTEREHAVTIEESPPEVITGSATPDATENTRLPEPSPELPWQDITVRSGDNLSLIFKRAGFDDGDVHRVVSQSREGKSLARIFPGQTIAFLAGDRGELAAVRHVRSPLVTVTYRLTETGFESEVEERTPETRETWAAGEITSPVGAALNRDEFHSRDGFAETLAGTHDIPLKKDHCEDHGRQRPGGANNRLSSHDGPASFHGRI